MKVIIGLTGVKGSGKNTVATLIAELFEESRELALANKLKNVCATVFEINRSDFDDRTAKEALFFQPIVLTQDHINQIFMRFGLPEQDMPTLLGMELVSPRHIAQIVGTEILRNCNDDIHCQQLEIQDGINIITDIRFPNEFRYFSNLSGHDEYVFIPIYIQRYEAENLIDPNGHASETSVFKVARRCIMVDNNGTLQYTKCQVKDILKEYFLIKDEVVNG